MNAAADVVISFLLIKLVFNTQNSTQTYEITNFFLGYTLCIVILLYMVLFSGLIPDGTHSVTV